MYRLGLASVLLLLAPPGSRSDGTPSDSRQTVSVESTHVTRRPTARLSRAARYAKGVVLVKLRSSLDASSSRELTDVAPAFAARLERLKAGTPERLFPEGPALLDVRSARRRSQAPPAALDRIYRIRIPADADVEAVVEDLRQDPDVQYAEPDYVAHVVAIPNDPQLAQQWGLAQINAPAAWDTVGGSPDVVIAVVDSGIEATHPDLATQLWVNPGEIAGNGLDDDANGYVDDVAGWNFPGNDPDLSDATGHGTEVAGVIAAATDNGIAVAGVCGGCRLMPLKVVQASGIANYSDIAAAVVYAARKGAEVINLSLGGYSDSATLRAAIQEASATATVVGGAGNDNGETPFYPAAYDEVLAVAGTGLTDEKGPTSNYGTWVDLSAPGVDIVTTRLGGGFGAASGTSMAAPFASGAAGLVHTAHPDWSPDAVRAHLMQTSDDIEALNPAVAGKLGSGRLNAHQAVTDSPTPRLSVQAYAVNGVAGGKPSPGATLTLTVTVKNDGAPITGLSGSLTSATVGATVNAPTQVSFGPVASFSTATNATAFSVTLAASVPFGTVVDLSLTAAHEGGATVLAVPVAVQGQALTVSGTLKTDTTWTADRIWHVTGNVRVSAGVRLTIEPGTEVRFDDGKLLYVDGELVASGLPDRMIVFTSAGSRTFGSWGPVTFNQTAVSATTDTENEYVTGSILKHVRIEYSRGVEALQSRPFVSDCEFAHNSINAPSGYPYSMSGVVSFFTGGSDEGHTIVVRRSSFRSNVGPESASLSCGAVSGVFVDYSKGHTVITDNTFSEGNGTSVEYRGHHALAGRLTLRGNRIRRSGGLAISNATRSSVVEANSVIEPTMRTECGYGAFLYVFSASPTIRKNLFARASTTDPRHRSSGGWRQAVFVDHYSAPAMTENTLVQTSFPTVIFFMDWSSYAPVPPGGEVEPEPGAGITANNLVGNTFLGGAETYLVETWHNSPTPRDVPFTSNYLGTTDRSAIDALIWDVNDDEEIPPLPRVDYEPVADRPITTAPGFLWQASVTPDPVGIQPLTVTLTFSRPMDPSSTPTVTFGQAAPYEDFSLTDIGRWIAEDQWQAMYDITTLVPRGDHKLSVSGARDSDGMEIPPDTRFGFRVDYAGTITDGTAPVPPRVVATGYESDPTAVVASWSATDQESGIASYRYAIGSVRGSRDVVDWTTTSATLFARTGLGLTPGRDYWVSVQARNGAGLWSAAGDACFRPGALTRVVSAPPFGTFDTPAHGATGVSGAIPVTGWSLDDVGVTKVEIYRDPMAGEPTRPNGKVYLGDATFVPGARPDVAAAYPSSPSANRAGWGYMLLTNMLPGQGNGRFRLYAYAHDAEGQATPLGMKAITCDNAHAAKPFGTIDTPGQGETVSGTIVNFGWALTPGTAVVPFDGSTITVYVDGVPIGSPTAYGLARTDIDALFPGYTNTGHAVGHRVIDTTALANGLHTLAWVVTDDQGRADGIGSRYFWVQN